MREGNKEHIVEKAAYKGGDFKYSIDAYPG
jgi:hypothetical protein